MNFFLVRLVVWFVTLALFPIPVTVFPRSFAVEVLERINLSAPAARECAELSRVEVNLAERVLVRLEEAEKKEIDPWLRDDIRIAWITTRWSQTGVPEWAWHRDSPPYVAATYQVLNCLPDEVWPRIVATRKAQLGSLYSALYDENASLARRGFLSAGAAREETCGIGEAARKVGAGGRRMHSARLVVSQAVARPGIVSEFAAAAAECAIYASPSRSRVCDLQVRSAVLVAPSFGDYGASGRAGLSAVRSGAGSDDLKTIGAGFVAPRR